MRSSLRLLVTVTATTDLRCCDGGQAVVRPGMQREPAKRSRHALTISLADNLRAAMPESCTCYFPASSPGSPVASRGTQEMSSVPTKMASSAGRTEVAT